MQNTIQKFRQSSIVFEKPGILSENLKTFDELPLPYSSIFFAETLHAFSTYQFLQKCFWDFFISFRSCVICKDLKRSGFYTLVFYTFINNSRYKQNRKNPTHTFVDITK